jgi:hypothetical protein
LQGSEEDAQWVAINFGIVQNCRLLLLFFPANSWMELDSVRIKVSSNSSCYHNHLFGSSWCLEFYGSWNISRSASHLSRDKDVSRWAVVQAKEGRSKSEGHNIRPVSLPTALSWISWLPTSKSIGWEAELLDQCVIFWYISAAISNANFIILVGDSTTPSPWVHIIS